ncbi:MULTISPECIES: isochorismate synthase [Pseudomonas syringae group genomosp. 2]|uniref:isochorismate synthase n=1 Tax=Pseudomonas syringae group genomosp. 2 TaxID=251698 RepID=UPI0001CC26F0|nr:MULTISPECIES: isochorismate synthase MenF [Pseudomonas syringae group genomosp. 2]EGH01694.1 isochorismate synthase [Pseudomonas amygdali pv. aesculi str. 0893_23]KPW15831.1 Isochorismate synthase [Pseudomonas amygdali pv. aesculi]KWT10990.1 isochorismate synthase [Pseudomonas amygdali pv. aesculi]KWT20832.1 isochorismate synthase [Pseudomonas amygdali pv. aesculi]KWT28294.1 isochorismate synthase [Pseudomonas amygdali pv. aesculi]
MAIQHPGNERYRTENAHQEAHFLFRSGSRSLRGQGIFSRISRAAGSGGVTSSAFLAEVGAALARARESGIDNPIVMGAIPFDTTQPSCLYIPRECAWVQEQGEAASKGSGVRPHVLAQRSIPDKAGFKAAVNQAIANFRSSSIRKAVLSRQLDIQLTQPVDVEQVLANLAAQNPKGYHFRIPMDDGAELIGVSPELLVRKTGDKVFTHPLAGSAKRRADAVEDREAGEALLASQKDQYEHSLVIDDIRRVLEPVCSRLEVPSAPSLLSTAAMWHLSTALEGQLRDPQTSVLQLACQIHPTPAVCGVPTQLARKLIDLVEPIDRGLFSGMVGWCDSQGNGEWVVTIRCGAVQHDRICLFAGAGIVEASCPDSEWKETQAKLGTMLAACGLDAQVGCA